MFKNPKFEKYLYLMFAGFGAISLSVLFFFALYKISSVAGYVRVMIDTLMPFVYGSMIAYLMYPINQWITERMDRFFGGRYPKISKFSGIFASLLLFALVIYLLLWMVLPQLLDSIVSSISRLPQTADMLTMWVERLLENNEPLQKYAEALLENSYAQLEAWLKEILMPGVQALLTGLSSSVIATVMGLFDFVIGLIVCVYILSSKDQFQLQIRMIIKGIFPERFSNIIFEIIRETDLSFGGFIRGKLLDSLIMGVICFVGTSLMKLPYAIVVSVVVGITNIIPFFGPFIGAIPSAFLILTVNPIQCIYFIIFILILQQVDGNIIGPAILGQSTGVSSIWVLFSILVFGKIFGVMGMIIGVPVFSILYYLFSKYVFRCLEKKGLRKEIDEYREKYPDKREERDRKNKQKEEEKAEKLKKWEEFGRKKRNH
ncbi:MAG: AI-2E family transporter [Lachnospiraceae bacterium]